MSEKTPAQKAADVREVAESLATRYVGQNNPAKADRVPIVTKEIVKTVTPGSKSTK